MAQLYLVRHAQASFGEDDYDKLSDLGHQQSSLLGEYFKERNIEFDKIITGDMLRHKQTADGIISACARDTSIQNQPLHSDQAWNEFDFENIVQAYLTMHPEHKPASNAPRSDWYKVLKNAMLSWSEAKLDLQGGETWEAFCARVEKGAKKILASESKRVLVVTSGGAMAVFLMSIFGTSVEKAIAFNLQIKNTSVNELVFNRHGFQLSTFNTVPHLDSLEHLTKITYS